MCVEESASTFLVGKFRLQQKLGANRVIVKEGTTALCKKLKWVETLVTALVFNLFRQFLPFSEAESDFISVPTSFR